MAHCSRPLSQYVEVCVIVPNYDSETDVVEVIKEIDLTFLERLMWDLSIIIVIVARGAKPMPLFPSYGYYVLLTGLFTRFSRD